MAHFRMQSSALVCVSGRYASKAGNSTSLLFNSFQLGFEIKQNNQIIHGFGNFFNLVQRIKNFSNKRV